MIARRRNTTRNLIVVAVVTLAGAAGGLYLIQPRPAGKSDTESADVLADAREALDRSDWAAAERLARQAIEAREQPALATFIAGKAAAGNGRFAEAVQLWKEIPSSDSDLTLQAAVLAGNTLLDHLHQATEAEKMFRRALEIDEDHVPALQRLAFLLAAEGRATEAKPLILRLFDQGIVDLDQLALLGMTQGHLDAPDLLRECHLADRSDPHLLLGLASSRTFNVSPAQARLLLQVAVEQAPTLFDAQIRLGTMLLNERDSVAFVTWHEELPEGANEHAGVWSVRGSWAEQLGESDVAIRCFWEAVRRDPNDRVAVYQLSQLLLREGKKSEAEPLLERGDQLQQLRQKEDLLLHAEHTSLEPMREVVEQLVELGRLWEAWGWCEVALRHNNQEAWALEQREDLAKQLDGDLPITLATANPVANLDLSSYPLPDWQTPETVVQSTDLKSTGKIAFTERAREVGLDFTYFCNSHAADEGKRMYEFPGGGVAVLDFDLDGWPDLHLTQGCRWPVDAASTEHLDRLFRNHSGMRFSDVTASAFLTEPNFSHGVNVGDFDNDGFPDLYVANIGANRLFRNNGDGTFVDVSENIVGAGAKWTTSCLVADLNGDSLPDLYDVNYAEADDIFDRVCKHADGVPRMCMPFHFPAAQDQFYANQGDGTFSEATVAAGFQAENGKGLGIVAADFDGSRRLSLFIANDTTPNFFFQRGGGSPGEAQFRELGVFMGVAFNASGRAEGCMGVAAGDVDQDGRLDLFVGNFIQETNTLYLQDQSGFIDATTAFHLAEPSLDLLAFGTQFVDADLDGDLDLLITNGHVDDVRAYDRPYHMRAQVFEKSSDGPFIELTPSSAGSFFATEHLGRGLATLDWNRDGRVDAAISHLDSNMALLNNASSDVGNFIQIRLCGVESARDAIGTTVSVFVDGRTLVRQLTAGDGYQSSNERLLTFGLGTSETVEKLRVEWPSGVIRTYEHLPAGKAFTCIETSDRLYPQIP
ncbi:MAG TPA: FG-GAP-like repeat-containing protein [Pirellulaceae bacterium]|nr:FG-GAP-like repeat-containing protein [Pirellulaceae bacterium]